MAQENKPAGTSRRKIGKKVVRRSGGIDTQQSHTAAAQPTATPAELYGYRISWQPSQHTFIATCLEFPAVKANGASTTAALDAAHQQVAQHMARAEAEGQEVPEPLSARNYSGKLQVRLGEDLHRALAQQAAENGMSLNQLIVKKLSAG